MTIQEAIKSKKKIKRPDWCDFLFPEVIKFSLYDLLQEDWMVEETKVTITHSEFYEAIHDAIADAVCQQYHPTQVCTINPHYLASRLGL